MESHTGETDDALVVDIPLLIAQQAAAGLGDGAKKSIDRRGAAPLEVVVILLHQIPETAGVAGFHAVDAGAVAESDLFHFAALGGGGKLVAIAAAHMRHVDAED